MNICKSTPLAVRDKPIEEMRPWFMLNKVHGNRCRCLEQFHHIASPWLFVVLLDGAKKCYSSVATPPEEWLAIGGLEKSWESSHGFKQVALATTKWVKKDRTAIIVWCLLAAGCKSSKLWFRILLDPICIADDILLTHLVQVRSSETKTAPVELQATISDFVHCRLALGSKRCCSSVPGVVWSYGVNGEDFWGKIDGAVNLFRWLSGQAPSGEFQSKHVQLATPLRMRKCT